MTIYQVRVLVRLVFIRTFLCCSKESCSSSAAKKESSDALLHKTRAHRNGDTHCLTSERAERGHALFEEPSLSMEALFNLSG